MKKLDEVIEENGIRYKLSEDDIYYPELGLNEEIISYGKYGMLRKSFLKEHKRGVYSSYLLTGKLDYRLREIDERATERMEVLVRQMIASEGIDEHMKEENWLLWVQSMNSVRNSAEEIVLQEIVYA